MLLPACLYSLEVPRGTTALLSAATKKKKKIALMYLLQSTLIRRMNKNEISND
jgi:hypothetical protein